jgi:cytochrome c oxidase assembly protein subunit 15
MAVATAIEFSHRAVVGVESMLIIALAIAGLALYRRRKEMRILAPLMVAFLFAQAGLGAWAVMYPQEAAILALHFGVSLISFASVLLTAVFLFEVENGEEVRNRPITRRFRQAVWGVTLYSYVVVYLGAFVRHVEADEACSGWPLCNGSVIPGLQGKVAAAFAHRFAAGLLVLAILSLVLWSYRLRSQRPDLFRAGLIALGVVVLQALAGALVVFTRVDLFSALAHAGLAGALFGSLTYLCLHVLPLPADGARRNASGLAVAS